MGCDFRPEALPVFCALHPDADPHTLAELLLVLRDGDPADDDLEPEADPDD